ncbi:UNVERIFIED_CONTAM: hypothetical protein GTU68_014957 [Idotea baltica]|nr:hypothetical protein [Idotea baltica]
MKISLPLNKFHIEHQKGGMKTKLLEVVLKNESIMTLPKDIQLDPVTDLPIHVDLFRIGKGSMVEIAIAVRILNEEKSVGIKKGGVINMAHREILLKCHPTSIPQHIEIDVADLDIGQSIHLADVTLPKGVEAIEDAETTILSLVGRAEEVEEEVVAEEGAEDGAEGEAEAK